MKTNQRSLSRPSLRERKKKSRSEEEEQETA
jgi:hypothetical protein